MCMSNTGGSTINGQISSQLRDGLKVPAAPVVTPVLPSMPVARAPVSTPTDTAGRALTIGGSRGGSL